MLKRFSLALRKREARAEKQNNNTQGSPLELSDLRSDLCGADAVESSLNLKAEHFRHLRHDLCSQQSGVPTVGRWWTAL